MLGTRRLLDVATEFLLPFTYPVHTQTRSYQACRGASYDFHVTASSASATVIVFKLTQLSSYFWTSPFMQTALIQMDTHFVLTWTF